MDKQVSISEETHSTLIALRDKTKVPIKYIGVGEGIHHLQIFNKRAFVDSIFEA